MQIISSFLGGGRHACPSPTTDYLIDADQKIPDWPITITFLGKVKTTVRSGSKSGRVAWILVQVMPFGAFGFSL